MHSRSSDPLSVAIDDGVDRVRAAVEGIAASNAVVLIDGRSGAGKTSFAAQLIAHWPLRLTPQRIALDDIYPGWDGLDDGALRALQHILLPHARGVVGTWFRWDWERKQDAEPHAVDPARSVVIEGSGILTPETARLADVTVWLEAPDAVRRTRALARDGETYRPHWDRWAAQEERHLRRDRPRDLAQIVVTLP